MKQLNLSIFFLFIFSAVSYGQIGINYHQSTLPFFGIIYEIKELIKPEIRIGTNTFFEDASVEIITTYDFLNTEEYEVYVGAGIRIGEYNEGIVLPIGVAFYPFTIKKFGFHIEVAPIFREGNILRGSWGIRYKFVK